MKHIAIIISLLITSFCGSGQIVYFDIAPDAQLSGDNAYSLNMILPPDSINSNYFTGIGYLDIWSHTAEISVACPLQNKTQLLTEATGTFPLALTAGQTIDSTGKWVDANYNIMNGSGTGSWINATDKYLGVRFKQNNNWYYGWIRMDINQSGTTATIKDRAYYNVINKSIKAGQQSATAIEGPAGEAPINITVTDKEIQFTGLDAREKYKLVIRDMTGREITDGYLPENAMIDMKTYPGGVYILTLVSREKPKSFKIAL